MSFLTQSDENPTSDQIFWANKDDTAQPFNEIHSTSEKMRQQMIEISDYRTDRRAARLWVENMRFLVQDCNEGDRDLQDCLHSITEVNSLPRTKLTRPPTLSVKTRKLLEKPSSYVALSYSWNREFVDWFPIQDSVVICDENLLRRESYSPSEVLFRALAYAAHKNVHAIWIDQDCINQKDPSDKEHGIQAMDIVYQEASHPIAVLETYLETQAEVDSLFSLLEFTPFEPCQIGVLADVLGSLVTDSWFTRAWTLQESLSAGVTMVLLIGCGTQLNKPEFFGPTPGEIEISIWDFQMAMVYARLVIEEHLSAKTWPNDDEAIQASNFADELYNLFPSIYPSDRSGPRDSSHRQSCSAAEAIRYLADRSNSFFPDRLSILANLCNYECRISSKILEMPQYAFTTCAMTLAILNGDMSLLGGHQGEDLMVRGESHINARSFRNVFEENDTDSLSETFGFSWGPKPTGSLKNVRYRDEHGDMLRLTPSTISQDGLRVSGMLWQDRKSVV